MPLAEVRDRTEVRWIARHDHHEVRPLHRRPGDPPRRIEAARVRMQKQPRHHLRVERRLATSARVAAGRCRGPWAHRLQAKGRHPQKNRPRRRDQRPRKEARRIHGARQQPRATINARIAGRTSLLLQAGTGHGTVLAMAANVSPRLCRLMNWLSELPAEG